MRAAAHRRSVLVRARCRWRRGGEGVAPFVSVDGSARLADPGGKAARLGCQWAMLRFCVARDGRHSTHTPHVAFEIQQHQRKLAPPRAHWRAQPPRPPTMTATADALLSTILHRLADSQQHKCATQH